MIFKRFGVSFLLTRHLVCMGIKRWGCKQENPGCRNCSSSLTPAWIGSLWPQSLKLVECWVLSFSLISGAGTHISFSQRTFELRSCPAKTPAGTSSSPATAKMGTGIALGGVTGTASGKVYIFEARNAAHCSLTKVSDSSSLAMALFCLAASAAEQAKPFTTGPTLLCRATPPLRSPSSLIRFFTRWSNYWIHIGPTI